MPLEMGCQKGSRIHHLSTMWSTLLNSLLATTYFNTGQLPFSLPDMPNAKTVAPMRSSPQRKFELKSGGDVFSPKDLIELPRPGVGVANPDKADLVIVPVSQYSFDAKKTNKTIYISPLDSTIGPIEFPIITGGEAFWLDARTIAHVVGDNLFAVSVEYNATNPSNFVTVPAPPYLVGSFPAGSEPTNFKFTGSKKAHADQPTDDVQPILVFSAKVYDDYNLTSVKEQDEAWAGRDTSALVYDELYVRHWDEYIGPKKARLFSVELAFDEGSKKWVLGEDYYKPLEGTEHYSPVEPFGGTDIFDVSGTHIVYTAKDPQLPEAWHSRQQVYVVLLKGGLEPRQITAGHQGATHAPIFSPDGKFVAWAELAKDGYESDRGVVILFDLVTAERYVVSEHWDRSAQEIVFSEDNEWILVTATEHGHVKIFAFHIKQIIAKKKPHHSHPKPFTLTNEHSSHGLQVLPGPKLLFTQSSLTEPNNVFVASFEHKEDAGEAEASFTTITKVTDFGKKELSGKSLDSGESFWFHGAEKHRKVQGWSIKPHGYSEELVKKGKKWPVAFLIHGGPQGAWEDGWSTRWNPNVWAQQGYWVIAINPTGSTGFGQDFTDAITREWGGKPFVDLRKGWEHALKHFPIDKERAVAAGGSWGGFAINWIQGHPDYGFGFKALFCHDGIFDTRNGGYTTDELYFWNHDFGGEPWDEKTRKLADKFNPSEFVHKWSTPHLIVHGGKDYRLDETEALAAFNALQQRGVPSRLVLFPDENHWVLKPANSFKWHYEVFRWFDEFVGEETSV